MNLSTECLGTAQVELLLQGNLTPDEYTSAQEHMEVCEQCRRRIEETIGPEQWWGDVQSVLLNSRGSLFSNTQAKAEDAEPNDTPTAKLLDLLGPTDDPNMLGRIGPYEIIGLLGQGGMGAVFKGFDRSLNRFVAIKMLLPHLAASGAARKRFAREGQAVAAVVDDHVMAIHCVDEWQGVPYLVMTYSRGVSLQKRLSDNGPLEVREILRIGMQAAKGLAAAHAQGIVHRDIKPANIFLDQNVERVQLMDFGLARAVDDASLTRSGTLAGTPQYMSPEQARAETVDHLSDLFSLGSVMYAMCTGHAPFRAESSYSVLRLITDKEPRPIREINSDIPEWLCAITSKLMAKQASDRFASAQEVAQLLEDCLAHVQQPAAIPLPVGVQALAAQSRSSSTESLQANRLKAKHQRIPPIGKFIAAAAGSFALIFAGVLVVLELNKGTLTIECDADDVPIRIMQGDNVVERMTVSKSPQNVRIAAGNYVVEVDGDFQGVTIKDGRVSLTRHGVATVEISKNAKLVLASNFQPGNIDGLRFGGRHERIDPRNRGYANIQVAEPGETNKYFDSFPTLGNGIEEVGLLVSVEPPHEPTEPSNWKSYLVRASGIRRIKNYSACEASVEGKSFFKLDDEPYTVGYFQLQLDGEEKENVTVDMIAGSAHVNINYVVGLPNEQVRKVLKLDAPNKHSESWLSVNLQTRPQSAWASHLMKLDGWEYDRTRGVPNMIQREVALRSGETQTVTIEPADVRDVSLATSSAPNFSTWDKMPAQPTNSAIPARVKYFTAGDGKKIACSPDGKLIAVANGGKALRVAEGWKRTVEILDAETGRAAVSISLTTQDEDALLAATEGPRDFEVGALAFSPDRRLLAVGTTLGQVKLFESRTGKLVLSLDDEAARLADQKTPEKLKSLKRAMGSVGSLAFSPDGLLMATSGLSFEDAAPNWGGVHELGRLATGPGRLKVWGVQSGELRNDLVGHSHANAVAFSPNGTYLASVGSWQGGGGSDHDGSGVILWAPNTGIKLRTFPVNTNGGTWSVAFSPKGKLMAISSRTFDQDNDTSTSSISLLRTATGILEWKQTVSGWGHPVAFTPDGKSVGVLCLGEAIRFFDTETGTLKHHLGLADPSQGARWNDFALLSQGRLAIAGVDNSRQGKVEIWDFTGFSTAANVDGLRTTDPDATSTAHARPSAANPFAPVSQDLGTHDGVSGNRLAPGTPE